MAIMPQGPTNLVSGTQICNQDQTPTSFNGGTLCTFVQLDQLHNWICICCMHAHITLYHCIESDLLMYGRHVRSANVSCNADALP